MKKQKVALLYHSQHFILCMRDLSPWHRLFSRFISSKLIARRMLRRRLSRSLPRSTLAASKAAGSVIGFFVFWGFLLRCFFCLFFSCVDGILPLNGVFTECKSSECLTVRRAGGRAGSGRGGACSVASKELFSRYADWRSSWSWEAYLFT